MAVNISPIANNQVFGTLLARVDQLIAVASTNTITSDTTVIGGFTTGNATLNGFFVANNLVAMNNIRGGNNTTSNTLSVISNTNFINGANTLFGIFANSTTTGISANINSVMINTTNVNISGNTATLLFTANATFNTQNLLLTANLIVQGSASFNSNSTFNILTINSVSSFLSVNTAITQINSNTIFNGTSFSVDANTILYNTLTVNNAVNFSNTLNVVGNTTLSNLLSVVGATTLSNTLTVAGSTSVGANFTANGNGSFVDIINLNASNTTYQAEINFQTNNITNWQIGQQSSADAYFYIYNTSLGRTVLNIDEVTGNIILTGNTLFNNSVNLPTVANTDNSTNAASTAYVKNTSVQRIGDTVSGPMVFSNTLSVTGNTTLSNLLSVVGPAAFSNTLSVTGNTTLSNLLSVVGPAAFSNTLTVAGATNLNNTVNITGGLTANTANVTGTSNFGGLITTSDSGINIGIVASTGFYRYTGSAIALQEGGINTNYFGGGVGGSGMAIGNTLSLGWSSRQNAAYDIDTGFSRLGAGSVGVGNGTVGDVSGTLTAGTLAMSSVLNATSGTLNIENAGITSFYIGTSAGVFNGIRPFLFSNPTGSVTSGPWNTGLQTTAINTLSLLNSFSASTTGQSFRVYNTFTNTNDGEWGEFGWTTLANTLSIGTTLNGTGVTRNLRFIIGGISKADYGITTASTWTFVSNVNISGTTSLSVATATTVANTDNSTNISTTAYVKNTSVQRIGDTVPGPMVFSNTVNITGFLTTVSANVVGNMAISGNLQVSGNLTYNGVSIGNLIPPSNSYSLGNTTNLWSLFGYNGNFTNYLTAPTVSNADNSNNVSTTNFVKNVVPTLTSNNSLYLGGIAASSYATWSGANNYIQYNENNNLSSNANFTYNPSNQTLNVNNTNTNVITMANTYDIQTGTYVFINTSEAIIDSFVTGVYRSGEYLIQLTDPTSNSYHVTKVLYICDSVNSYTTEFATMYNNSSLGSFRSTISSGNVNILCTPSSATVVVKFSKNQLTV